MAPTSSLARIGTSGFSYSHWRGCFYPSDLRQARWLEHYAGVFRTVELNVTFYRVPGENVFRSWRERTPDGFLFAVKGTRLATHRRRLRDCEEVLRFFLERVATLGAKLGPILWQVPPSLKRDDQLLARFLGELQAAARSGAQFRHAVEFRDPSWFHPRVYELLTESQIALCCAHSQAWPTELRATSQWHYLRFHGGEQLYGSCYTEEELANWAERLATLVRSRVPVFAYFNNDAHGYAVANALRLRELVGDRAGSA